MNNFDWNEQAKRFLKSELVRRGVTNEELVFKLNELGLSETKASVESKISRGTFSAAFLLQCLNAIGCKSFDTEVEVLNMAAEPQAQYKYETRKRRKKNDIQQR